MVVVITSTGGVSKRVFALAEAVDTGLALWAGEYLNERLIGLELGSATLRRRFEDQGLTRSGARGPGAAPARVHGADRRSEQRVFVGGAASLLGEVRADELEACQRLLETLEKRAAILEMLGETLGSRRPYVRVGGELDNPALRDVSLVGALVWAGEQVARRREPARATADGLREGDPLRPRRRPRALPLRRVRLRRQLASLLMATTGRDYYEVLGVGRTATEAEIKRAFRRLARELHPDVSEEPDAEERFREAVAAYEVLSKTETRSLYDRFGHAGLQSGGFRPTAFDFGSLADIFSAFFGDDAFGVGSRPRRGRGADVAAEVVIDLEEAASGIKREVPIQVARACDVCGGDGVEPGTTAATCDECHGSGRIEHVARTSLGEFVRSQACARCGGAGRIIEHPCARCEGAGRMLDERTLEIEIPAGIHDGQRIRLSGEGHAGAVGGQAGDLYVLVRIRPRRAASSARGTTSSRPLDLTMTPGRPRRESRRWATLDGEVSSSSSPGTRPGELRVLRGRGMPVLQGFGRGDQRVLVNVAVPRQPQRGAAATCSESSTRLGRPRRRTGPTRASSRS